MKYNFNPANFDPIRQVALQFPGTQDSVSHDDTHSIKVGKKFMCRLHSSGEFIPIRLDFSLRDAYLELHPETFHLPDHYKNYPYICMWLNNYSHAILKEVLEHSWRGLATKKMIKEWQLANE